MGGERRRRPRRADDVLAALPDEYADAALRALADALARADGGDEERARRGMRTASSG